MRPTRVLSQVALTAGAVIGTGCLLLALGALALGIRPVIFRSGSMAPTAAVGSLGIAHRVPAAALRVGDVVTVPYDGTQVTHRIVEITQGNGTATLRLKGDGNQSPDATLHRVSSAARLWFAVPWLGGAVSWLSRAPGIYLLGLYLGLMLVLAVRPRPEPPDRRGGRRRQPPSRHRGRPRRSGRRRAAATAVAVMAVVAGPGGPAIAGPWTDGVPVAGAAMTAATLPAPSTFDCGAVGLFSVTFGWAAVAGATSYTVHYGAGGTSTTTVAGLSTTIVSAISGGTAWVQANHNYGSVTWTSVASSTRTYTVAAVSLCG